MLAYPSLYEGFGFPPLEAMVARSARRRGTAGAVPEVVGDAAELVAPGDVTALAGALARVLDDNALRSRLIAAGRIRGGVVHLVGGGVLDDGALRDGRGRAAGPMTPVSVLLAAEQLRRRVPGGIGTYTRGLLQGTGRAPGEERPRCASSSAARLGEPDPLASASGIRS